MVRYSTGGKLKPKYKSKRGLHLKLHRHKKNEILESRSIDIPHCSNIGMEFETEEAAMESENQDIVDEVNSENAIIEIEYYNVTSPALSLNQICDEEAQVEAGEKFENDVMQSTNYEECEENPSPSNISPILANDEEYGLEPLLVEYDAGSCSEISEGCRIVDINYYERQVKELNDHHTPFHCNFADMVFIKEKRNGLAFQRKFKCAMCGWIKSIYSHPCMVEEENVLNINQAAAFGTIAAGVGQTALDKILSTMNIPTMSSATFSSHQNKVEASLMELSLTDMKMAAEEAAALARERGDVAADGVPLITVKCDGSWCKRSYKNNYNSTAGCGVIMSADTNKVLYVGIKNKYCIICKRADNDGETAKQHTCFKNWEEGKSSSSMETAAIVEGFACSESLYGIRYSKMIADGDCAVYKAVRDANPYDNMVVQKIECKNHLLRNFSNHLHNMCVTSSGGDRNVTKIKKLVENKILKLRSAINKAVKHRSNEGNTVAVAAKLAKDIINAPSHVFGEHLRCAEIEYFCNGKPKENEVNVIPQLKAAGLYTQIMERCNMLADHSKSLLYEETTNVVESFNSVIAAKISGKRVNFTSRGGYEARVANAVSTMAHGESYRHFHKKIVKRSPGKYSKEGEQRLLRRRINQRNYIKRRKLTFTSNRKKKGANEHYGPQAAKPDKDLAEYSEAMKRRLEWLKTRVENRAAIEEETRGQNKSSTWFELRRWMVTASNAGRICKLRTSTSTQVTINNILYGAIDSPALQWGRLKEITAKNEAARIHNFKIEECGLFVHPEIDFVGATPDGLLDSNSIIEIKCPFAARNMKIEEAVEKKKITYLERHNNEWFLKKKDSYFFQIQLQLEVTQKHRCAFFVWTPLDNVLVWIHRDPTFWEAEMKEKITSFYLNCQLPELVDPRRSRSLPLRNVNWQGEEVEGRKLKKHKAQP